MSTFGKLLPHSESSDIITNTSSNNLEASKKEIDDIRNRISISLNNLNSQCKDQNQVWELESIAKRKHFKGVKLRIMWVDKQTQFMIRLKLCTPIEIGGKKLNIDNYILELEDVNVSIQKNQNLFYKQLQHYLDYQIGTLLSMTKKVYNVGDQAWIMQFFPQLGVTLRENLIRGKAKKVNRLEFITLKKQKSNQNYMLIPPNTNFSWHPKGLIFLVQNPIHSQISGSLIGNKRMINKIFPPQKIQKTISIYHSVSYSINIDDPYDWDIKESYDFLDGQYEELVEIQATSSMASLTSQITRYRSLSMPFKSVNETQPQPTDSKDFIQGKLLNPTGSLKLFKITDCFSEIQFQMKQLTIKFQKQKQTCTPILQILLSSLYKNYDSLIHEKILGPFQIKIIQQIFKSSIKQNNYGALLQAIMAETQCNRSVIINTFNKNFVQLGAIPKYKDKMWLYYEYLITYNDFDEYQLQNIFMMILQLYISRCKLLNTDRKQIINPQIQDPLFVQVKKSPFIHPIQYVKFVSDELYNQVLNKFIPLYQIRTKHNSYLGYNRIMRIISANQRLRCCIQFINTLVSNDQAMKDIVFLSKMVEQYSSQRRFLKQCKQKRKKRRSWRIVCSQCRNATTINQVLPQNFVCSSCKSS